MLWMVTHEQHFKVNELAQTDTCGFGAKLANGPKVKDAFQQACLFELV